MVKCIAVLAAISAAFISIAQADIIYQPVNPSFGGSPLNSSHLQFLANTQKQYEETVEEKRASEQFLDMLESRLYSGLASQVTEAIFGEDALPSGTIAFSDQQVSFNNNGTEIHLVITDFTTGQVTTIVVPTIQAN
jgi:curli production assembly/transport component CsgF